MKYGDRVPGTWNMIAIKDAPVDGGPIVNTALAAQTATKGWATVADENHSTVLAMFAEFLSPIARKAMGRPGAYFGVTPIMIFREIAS